MGAYLDAIVASDRSVLEAAIRQSRVGARLRTTYRVISPVHGLRQILDVGTCYLGQQDQPTAIAGYLLDVTERNEPNKALALLERLEASCGDAHALNLNLVTYVLELAMLEIEARRR